MLYTVWLMLKSICPSMSLYELLFVTQRGRNGSSYGFQYAFHMGVSSPCSVEWGNVAPMVTWRQWTLALQMRSLPTAIYLGYYCHQTFPLACLYRLQVTKMTTMKTLFLAVWGQPKPQHWSFFREVSSVLHLNCRSRQTKQRGNTQFNRCLCANISDSAMLMESIQLLGYLFLWTDTWGVQM